MIAKINALNPNPGSWFTFKGSRIKITKAVEVDQQGRPGEVLSNNFIVVVKKCNSDFRIKKREKKMKVQDYIHGNKLKIGTLLNE